MSLCEGSCREQERGRLVLNVQKWFAPRKITAKTGCLKSDSGADHEVEIVYYTDELVELKLIGDHCSAPEPSSKSAEIAYDQLASEIMDRLNHPRKN